MVLRHIHTQCLDHAAQYSEVHLLVFLFFSFLRLEEHVWLRGVPVYVSVCGFFLAAYVCVRLYEHVPYIIASKHYYPHASLSLHWQYRNSG